MPPTASSTLLDTFFTWAYGAEEGNACICYQGHAEGSVFKQAFFKWPSQKKDMLAFIEQQKSTCHLWFSVHLFSKAERKKQFVLKTQLVWADLDECPPDAVDPPPQCVIESSPGRYNALWRLDEYVDPIVGEEISRRIAYAYHDRGADLSGWDLTQILRVPLTYNYKPHYLNEAGRAPQVTLNEASDDRYTVADFDGVPLAPEGSDSIELALPDVTALPSSDEIITQYWSFLHNRGFTSLHAYDPEPGTDWSASMWRLINLCHEAHMTNEEVFVVALASKCNKYVRDKRPISHLWHEVLKAGEHQRKRVVKTDTGSVLDAALTMPSLVSAQELENLPHTLVDDYIEWATGATDATPQFHQLSIFMAISMLTASGLKLEASYGDLHPNIWGLVVGDSTLTRKTTAMKMVTSMVDEIDSEVIIASDGSTEGLLTSMQTRPNQVSVYFRDEVAGFFDSIKRKDYLAGMPEFMAQLYDVPNHIKRRLRKESITAQKPYFIFFGGGIRDKLYSLIDTELILNGFIPRFLIVGGETDRTKLRPTGPAQKQDTDKRMKIQKSLTDIHQRYTGSGTMTIAGQETVLDRVTEVFLDNAAWARYQQIEERMQNEAFESSMQDLALPCFERLSRSLLKMTMLIAAIRQEPENNMIQATEQDVLYAAKYVQEWGKYTVDLILNSGRSQSERTIESILQAIREQPGVLRSTITQHRHLSKRQMDDIQGTLEDRGLITVERKGKAHTYYAV